MTFIEIKYLRRLEESHRGLTERVRQLEREEAALVLALREIIVQGHLDQLVEMIATAQRALRGVSLQPTPFCLDRVANERPGRDDPAPADA